MCPSGSTSCIQMVSITKTGDADITSFHRGCNDDQDLCNKDFIMNSGQGNKQIHVVSECCYKDKCNTGSIEVPPYNTTRNSFICPVCYTYENYDCKTQGYVMCRGLEIECFDFAATIMRQGWPSLKFAMMGCTTQGGCSIGERIMPGFTITDVQRLSCTRAHSITH